jgi:MFS family permease
VTWLVEERGFPYAEATFSAGVVGLLAGLLGNLAGGAFGDRCARRRANGHVWSLVPLTALFVLASVAFYLLPPGGALFYAAWLVAAGSASSWFGPLLAAVQEEAPAHARASAIAFAILVLNLFGVGPGPLVTGAIGDARGLTTGLLVSLAVAATAVVPFALAARAGLRAPAS